MRSHHAGHHKDFSETLAILAASVGGTAFALSAANGSGDQLTVAPAVGATTPVTAVALISPAVQVPVPSFLIGAAVHGLAGPGITDASTAQISVSVNGGAFVPLATPQPLSGLSSVAVGAGATASVEAAFSRIFKPVAPVTSIAVRVDVSPGGAGAIQFIADEGMITIVQLGS